MTGYNDLQHKLVNEVYAELGTISKHSQDVIDYLMRHGWIRTPAEAEAAARGEMPRRTMNKQELIEKIAGEYTHLAPAVDTIINAAEHEGWLRDPDQVPGWTITPDALAAAWASAEMVDEYQEGDVLIQNFYEGEIRVWTSRHTGNAPLGDLGIRRLSRAPQPSNAEKLEEILIDFECHPAHLIAEHLDKNGVTAPGGNHE